MSGTVDPHVTGTATLSATLGNLAIRHGCELWGDPAAVVDHVASLAQAGPGAISFLANPAYRGQLAVTGATAVILKRDDAADCSVAALIARDPYLVFARIAAELHPPPRAQTGIHARATVATGCTVPASCEIQAGAVLHERVHLGERVQVGANSVLGSGVHIGDDSALLPGVMVLRGRVDREALPDSFGCSPRC